MAARGRRPILLPHALPERVRSLRGEECIPERQVGRMDHLSCARNARSKAHAVGAQLGGRLCRPVRLALGGRPTILPRVHGRHARADEPFERRSQCSLRVRWRAARPPAASVGFGRQSMGARELGESGGHGAALAPRYLLGRAGQRRQASDRLGLLTLEDAGREELGRLRTHLLAFGRRARRRD